MSRMETSIPKYVKLRKLNNWEKKEGSTKEIVERVHKKEFGTIQTEKRECARSKGMARAN